MHHPCFDNQFMKCNLIRFVCERMKKILDIKYLGEKKTTTKNTTKLFSISPL